MLSALSFVIYVALLVPTNPLGAAQDCYDALDYVCADQQLALVLRKPQTKPVMLQARRLDLLLAFAWRDDARMQLAAKRLFELSPKLMLDGFPPEVRTLLEANRPAPPAPNRLSIGLQYRLQPLAPNSGDAQHWFLGEGVRLHTGLWTGKGLMIEGTAEWVRHYSRLAYAYDALDAYDLGAQIGRVYDLGTIDLYLGLGASISLQQIHIESSYQPLTSSTDLNRVGGAIHVIAGSCFAVWKEISACLELNPKLLFRGEEGQPRTSYLFPLGFGLRYEYRLNTVSESK